MTCGRGPARWTWSTGPPWTGSKGYAPFRSEPSVPIGRPLLSMSEAGGETAGAGSGAAAARRRWPGERSGARKKTEQAPEEREEGGDLTEGLRTTKVGAGEEIHGEVRAPAVSSSVAALRGEEERRSFGERCGVERGFCTRPFIGRQRGRGGGVEAVAELRCVINGGEGGEARWGGYKEGKGEEAVEWVAEAPSWRSGGGGGARGGRGGAGCGGRRG
jgi:hypothetical protein